MTNVTITEAPLAVEDLLAVADGARVELSSGVRARIAASRAVVDKALTTGAAVRLDDSGRPWQGYPVD